MSHETTTTLATVTSDLGSVSVSNAVELDSELDRITASVKPEHPVGITIERSNHDTLMMILGAPAGVLSFNRADGMPPYFVTLGDPSEDGVLAYWLTGNHHGEVPRWSLVPNEDAREAARRFIAMEYGLPSNVTWASV
jgi:Immunity protein Imm1